MISDLKDQFKDKNYSHKDYERAIDTAMKELKISRRKAMSELMMYMCAHGSIEDFKNYINYFIEMQDKFEEE